MITEAQVFGIAAEADDPVHAEIAPVREPVVIIIGLAEEFHFHLLELTGSEDEVARCDLIAEGLADLTDAERKLFSVCALNILEINEHTLGCFRSQVNGALGVFQCALECLEHQVELTDRSEVVLAAVGARNLVVLNELFHLFIGPAFTCDLAFRPVFDQLVGAVSCLALFAVH